MNLLPLLAVAVMVGVAGCTTTQTANSQDQVLDDGTVLKPDGTMVKPDGTMVKPDGTMILPDGSMVVPEGEEGESMDGEHMEEAMDGESMETPTDDLVKLADNYFRYDEAAFNQAREDGKVIFLDFHADWCPTCINEHPKIVSAFNTLDHDDVIGFQVHFRDGQTLPEDEAASHAYGVSYQHTKVFIDGNGAVTLKTLEVLESDEIIAEIEKARAAA